MREALSPRKPLPRGARIIVARWREGTPARRRRGGQPGNRNALKHGAYSAAALRLRAWLSAFLKRLYRLVRRAKLLISNGNGARSVRRAERMAALSPPRLRRAARRKKFRAVADAATTPQEGRCRNATDLKVLALFWGQSRPQRFLPLDRPKFVS